MTDQFAAAGDFIRREGRLLERRLFATYFEGAPASGVVDALRGYRNEDGGFGHGLEPDKRCPASQAIDVEVALQALVTAQARDRSLVGAACDFLADLADKSGCRGAVPPASAVIEAYPHAAHWSEWTYVADINPTGGLVGSLHALGVSHPWAVEAEHYCWDRLEGDEFPSEVHALSEAMVFLAHAPERERAAAAAGRVRQVLDNTPMFKADPDEQGYGLTPLSFAPLATSRWRPLFSEAMLEAHLDRLLQDQQPDGGWPITWDPPGEAARWEWRGIVTLSALRTLVSYGRLRPS
jgi:hypothetical protein